MQNIFLTWHYTSHGIAYMKHILSAFHQKNPPPSRTIHWLNLSQIELQAYFDQPAEQGFWFDEVIYLTAEQEVFDQISNRKKYRTEMTQDNVVLEEGTAAVWKALLEGEDLHSADYVPSLERDLDFVQQHFPEKLEVFKGQLWRDVQHYHITDQIEWFKNHSNAGRWYGDRLNVVQTNVKNLRDAKDIAKEVKKVVDNCLKRVPDARFFINISLGSNETQVVWHALAEGSYLPDATVFLQTYDDKSDVTNLRFKKFIINEVPTNIFDLIKPAPIFKNTKSNLRKIADLKMQTFLKMGFSILVLGERGVGKSALVDKYRAFGRKLVSANCAAFDDDSKAESELFGYVKGAFTGATKDTGGLFQEANGGFLFLDEIHHLSKRVQSKLMLALQTDSDNYFHIRKMGSSTSERINCRVIIASNRSLQELRDEFLYQDFFDRISQNVVYIPSLRETSEDRIEDWQSTWQHMKLNKNQIVPNDDAFLKWLQRLDLYGNYRDLQKIAIFWNAYDNFNPSLKELLHGQGIKNNFDYVKKEFEKLQSPMPETFENAYFSSEKTIQEMEKNFKKDLATWLNQQFGSMEKAHLHFKEKFGQTIETRTLYKWKNGK